MIRSDLMHAVRDAELTLRAGKVVQLDGMLVESEGPDTFLGEICRIRTRDGLSVTEAEVVGLRNGRVQMMPHGQAQGLAAGARVEATGASSMVPLGEGLLGRVINAAGQPLDGKPLRDVHISRLAHLPPINPLDREPIRTVLETGVKTIDCLHTIGRGQRMGIFAGSGVGKSTLLGMIARNVHADISVIALIGERGREVREFLENSLGEGLSRAVVVVATADEPPSVRARAALTATRIAEHFRDRERHVVLIMDSITRYAMARREIGLAVGEPPTARGYTPSVFARIPELVERAGNLKGRGSLTAFYTVLVEGDDLNDPVADHMRSILDGGIVLSRELANQGSYPAIDVLQSNSRLLMALASKDEQVLANRTQATLSAHERARDMIDVGAYRAGASESIDRAIRLLPELKLFMAQNVGERVSRNEALRELRRILDS